METRRPTGYVFNPPPPEEEDADENVDNTDASEPPADRRKSVIFDSRVQKRDVDSGQDVDDDKNKTN